MQIKWNEIQLGCKIFTPEIKCNYPCFVDDGEPSGWHHDQAEACPTPHQTLGLGGDQEFLQARFKG